MLENRNLKLDLLALGLLAAVIFLAAALLSYDPADPPSKLVFPRHSQPANVCGHSGAMASRLAVRGLGLGPITCWFRWPSSTPCCLIRARVGPALAAGRRLAAVAGGRDHAGRHGRAAASRPAR